MFWLKLYYSVILGFIPGILAGGIAACMGWRMPRGISGWTRSRCPSCGNVLSLIDAFPLLGYLKLRGRCRFCGVKISPIYFAVELAGGVASVAFFYAWGPSKGYLFGIVFLTCCLIAATADLDKGVIPDRLNMSIAFTGVVLLAVNFSPLWLAWALSGATIAYLTLYISSLITGKPFGGGDVKFMTTAGILLGPLGVCLALLFSVFSAVGVEVLIRRRGFGQSFPFGPYLALGSIAGWVALPLFFKTLTKGGF